MHSRREAAEKILSTFFYAFRAKREKKVMHFLNILCSFGQTLKKNTAGTSIYHSFLGMGISRSKNVGMGISRLACVY